MKTRVAELTIAEYNAEKRPCNRIYQYQFDSGHPVIIVVEYLDVYEYTISWQPSEVEQKETEGWGIVNSIITDIGDQHWVLRRVKPDSEATDD